MNEPKQNDGPAIDSGFLTLLQNHRGGQALCDLSEGLRKAIQAAQLQGKPAGIVLKIAIKPAGQGCGAIIVADDIKVKLPENEKVTSFFYSDEAGNLHRNDPKQRELPLRTIEVVSVDPATLKHVRTATL